DVGAHVRYHAALGLDAGRHALSAEVDRQPDTDRLVLDHALQIHVHDHVLRRVHLHVLDDGFLGALADLQPHDRGVEALVGDHGEKILLVQNEGLGVLAGAVQDGGDLAGVTQAAARTLALHLADIRAEGERNTHYMSPLVAQYFSRRTASSPTPRRGCGGWFPRAAPPPTAGGYGRPAWLQRPAGWCPSRPAHRAPTARSFPLRPRTAPGE